MAAHHNLICAAGHKTPNVLLPFGERPPCHCGAATEILWAGKAACVIADDIPGGIYIKHGIGWPDGTPRKFYSHTEIKAAAVKAGLQQHVEHMPERGSDKSKHTSRWV
jgi:hypothetical protein